MELVASRTPPPGRWLGVLVSVVLVSAPVWAQEDEVEVSARPAASSSAVPQPSSAPAVPPSASASAAVPAASAAASGGAAVGGLDALRQRLDEIDFKMEVQRKEIEAREQAMRDGSSGLVRGAVPSDDTEPRPWRLPPRGLLLTGYVQGQYEASQASEDQLQQGGAPLNQDRFLVRRARLRLTRTWRYVAAGLELDGNTVRGNSFGLRRAEGSVFYRPDGGDGPPLVMFTMGLSDIPFGFELVDQARSRIFMERSTASQAFFPSEPDLGVRLSGGVGFVRYTLAFLNGEPLDDRAGRYPVDPNAHKDLVGRVGVEVQPAERWRVSAGTSLLRGEGFHPGTSAGKNQLVWRDANENSVVDQGEVSGVPGQSATPSESFERWAVGLDAQARWRSPLGWAALWGEVTLASNLDRAYLPADPVLTGLDVRHFGYYVAISQEIGRHGLVAFRHDSYDPNSDFFARRAGKLVPTSQTVSTYSPAAGLILPGQGRLIVQYDIIRDLLGKDARGVPTDLKNNRLTLRLQVEL
jgi:hypothetical protein